MEEKEREALLKLIELVIEEYRKSKLFEEDACEYCRENGWTEPS